MKSKELQERFEQIFRTEYHEKKGTYIDCMQAAYTLAQSESEDTIKSQAELLDSMQETKDQMAKRLLRILDVIGEPAAEGVILNKISLILNPTPETVTTLKSSYEATIENLASRVVELEKCLRDLVEEIDGQYLNTSTNLYIENANKVLNPPISSPDKE